MAVFDAVFVPAGAAIKEAALGASASSSEISLGENKIFAVSATDAYHVVFGRAGMDPADVADFRVPSGVIAVFDTGHEFTHVRFFNSTAAGIDIYLQPLSRF